MDVRNSIDGSLQISNEVVAKIAKLAALEIAVSYTHLTLPTILLV